MRISHKLFILGLLGALGLFAISFTLGGLYNEPYNYNKIIHELHGIRSNVLLNVSSINKSNQSVEYQKLLHQLQLQNSKLKGMKSELPASLIDLHQTAVNELNTYKRLLSSIYQSSIKADATLKQFGLVYAELNQQMIVGRELLGRYSEQQNGKNAYVASIKIEQWLNQLAGNMRDQLFTGQEVGEYGKSSSLVLKLINADIDVLETFANSSNQIEAKQLAKNLARLVAVLGENNNKMVKAVATVNNISQELDSQGNMAGESIHTLVDGVDEYLKKKLDETFVSHIYLTTIIAIVIILIAALFARSVLLPLKKLLSHVSRMSKGDLSHVNINLGNNELGILANAYDKLTAKLVDSNEKQESLVVQRTQDLLKTNDALIHEIKERTQAEEQAKQSTYELNKILNSMLDTVYRIDSEGRLEIASPSVMQLLGYTPDEMIGNLISDYYFEEDGRDKFLAALKASNGEIQNHEAAFRHKNGSAVWVLVSAHYLYDDNGDVIGIEGTTRDITKLKAVEDITKRLGRILDKSSNEIYIFDAETLQFNQVNHGALVNLGYSEEEIRTMTAVDIKPELNEKEFRKLITPLISKQKDVLAFETIHQRKDGTLYPVDVRLQLFAHEDPPIFVAIIQDISERRKLEEHARQLSSALEQTADSVMITDARGVVQYVNHSFERMSGYSKEEAIGGNPNIQSSGRQDKIFYKRLWSTITSGNVFQDILINKRKDGSYYYEEKTITPLKDTEGNIVNFVSTGKDISERMQAQEHLQYLAHHDPLTELPNRAMLTERMQHAIQLSQRNNSRLAVLFLDIDRFKLINDSLGHETGDLLLQNLAQRLCASVREGDTVARLGGDEFIVLVEGVESSSDAAHTASNIADSFAKPVYLEGQELYVTTSIGISMYPEDGVETGVLIKNADNAMYRAKDRGRNNYQFYSADMSSRAFERLTLESGLRKALEREEFTLYYQPQLQSSTGRIIGVEALIRWQHPELGLVSPADFIPLLEETGMIVPVGEWMLKTACQQNKYWQDQGCVGLSVSVNLSVRQFYEKNLIDVIARTLKETGLVPELLDLEITESVIMKSADTTIETLKNINKLGVSLAIDDFGTGYSSLSYLKRFPIDRLKVDQAFVRDITTDPDDAAIVSTIIAMAHNLKMGVVAEGVETKEQEQFLRKSGCEVMQGFLYSRPLSSSDMTQYLMQELDRLDEKVKKNRA